MFFISIGVIFRILVSVLGFFAYCILFQSGEFLSEAETVDVWPRVEFGNRRFQQLTMTMTG